MTVPGYIKEKLGIKINLQDKNLTTVSTIPTI